MKATNNRCFWKQFKTLFLGGSKIIADGDYSHEIKRYLLLERKAMTNLDKHIIKQRHYFANQGPYSQSYGFPSSNVRRLSTEELMLLNCGVGEDS